jgi:hypothetical protein
VNPLQLNTVPYYRRNITIFRPETVKRHWDISFCTGEASGAKKSTNLTDIYYLLHIRQA